MTRDEAISIRERQLCGEAVETAVLSEAVETIRATAHITPRPKRKRDARLVAAHCPDRAGVILAALGYQNRAQPIPFAMQHSTLAAAMVANRDGEVQSLQVVLVTDFYGVRAV